MSKPRRRSAAKLRAGFVLERSLGHITHADNLRDAPARRDRRIDAGSSRSMGRRRLGGQGPGVQHELDGPARASGARRASAACGATARSTPCSSTRRFPPSSPPAVAKDPDGRLGRRHAAPVRRARDALRSRARQPARRALKWRANRSCFRRAARIVAWSSWAKEGVVDGYGIDAGQDHGHAARRDAGAVASARRAAPGGRSGAHPLRRRRPRAQGRRRR